MKANPKNLLDLVPSPNENIHHIVNHFPFPKD
jgi:hypothetical protein